MSAPLGLVVTRQVRLQGITVGHRDGMEAMVRAIAQHGLKPVIDTASKFGTGVTYEKQSRLLEAVCRQVPDRVKQAYVKAVPPAAPLIATAVMSVVPCWLIEIDGAAAKALDDVTVIVMVPALKVGTEAGVVLVRLVLATFCEMFTCHARPAPDTIVVPGAIPHCGLVAAHAIT